MLNTRLLQSTWSSIQDPDILQKWCAPVWSVGIALITSAQLLGLFDAIRYLHTRSSVIIHGDLHDVSGNPLRLDSLFQCVQRKIL